MQPMVHVGITVHILHIVYMLFTLYIARTGLFWILCSFPKSRRHFIFFSALLSRLLVGHTQNLCYSTSGLTSWPIVNKKLASIRLSTSWRISAHGEHLCWFRSNPKQIWGFKGMNVSSSLLQWTKTRCFLC